MGLLTTYLIAYNLVSCAGWALVGLQVVLAASSGGGAAAFWQNGSRELLAVQTLAALEIVHSLLRLVKSPLMTVVLQVGSRLMVLWVYTFQAPMCHVHWGLLLMVGSWAMVEVPRYLFYALNLLPAFAGAKMPYPLFFLRYSLFMVLYPSGISGELLQIYVALTSFYGRDTPLERFLFVFPFVAYIPCGPFMIWNMWNNRKSQFKKRAAELGVDKKTDEKKSKKPAKPTRPVSGLVWPVTDSETGERSTSQTNQMIWEAAVANVAPEAAQAVRAEKKWRFGYAKHIETQVRAALASPSNALKIAEDGLAYAHKTFQLVREDETMSLAEAMDKFKGSYETGFIKGTGEQTMVDARIDYYGRKVRTNTLKLLLERWVKSGTMEPSAAEAIRTVMENPEWVDLSDHYFVLLGATSAMGPLDVLLECGANIVAIDLDRPAIWEKLVTKARASAGTLTFPLRKPQADLASDEELFANAGANLLAETPEIANWLSTVCPGKALTVGNYTYLDGALHVQLSVACDAIMDKLCKARKDTSLAFLCTPTDVHCILKDAHDAAAANYAKAPMYQKFLEGKISKNDMVPNVVDPVEASGLYLTDGITVAQGPNYALAKRMQHWRCILAREAGHIVSSNVAPSTSTVSVTSNRLFAAAYEGFEMFPALEVMAPETSSSAMLMLLINDLRNPKSAANPAVKLDNPMQLFAYNAFHGGSFRCPYKIGSIGTACVGYYVLYKRYVGLIFVPLLSGLSKTVLYIATGK